MVFTNDQLEQIKVALEERISKLSEVSDQQFRLGQAYYETGKLITACNEALQQIKDKIKVRSER